MQAYSQQYAQHSVIQIIVSFAQYTLLAFIHFKEIKPLLPFIKQSRTKTVYNGSVGDCGSSNEGTAPPPLHPQRHILHGIILHKVPTLLACAMLDCPSSSAMFTLYPPSIVLCKCVGILRIYLTIICIRGCFISVL